jgi:hypothetical protein
MREPTPAALLRWWRALEPTLQSMCLKRTSVAIPVLESFDVPREQRTYRNVPVTSWHCSLCHRDAGHDDMRGIVHTWRRWNDKADCPLIRLHLKIREGEHQAHPRRARAPLADRVHELGESYIGIGHAFEATFWAALRAHQWRDSDESSGTRALSWAAFHIAQSCLVWMEPNRLAMREWAAYWRTCGDEPHGAGIDRYMRQAVDMYQEAALTLTALAA